MTGAHLLRLPRELRDLVYSYIIPDRIQLAQMNTKESLEFYNTNGFFLASHQLRDEALDAFYRLLPTTTIIAPRDTQTSVLSSPQETRLLQETQVLVIRTTYRKRNLPYFDLNSISTRQTNLYISRILQSMPALRHITCEVAWEPSDPPAVLLPRVREEVLAVIRWVTLRGDVPVGWDVECQIRNQTRWKNEWSGVVILKRI
jgi:hypothetical protein